MVPDGPRVPTTHWLPCRLPAPRARDSRRLPRGGLKACCLARRTWLRCTLRESKAEGQGPARPSASASRVRLPRLSQHHEQSCAVTREPQRTPRRGEAGARGAGCTRVCTPGADMRASLRPRPPHPGNGILVR